MTKTTAGLFERLDDAQAAATELLERGYSRETITLIAHRHTEDTAPPPLTPADIREDSRISTATRALAGGVVGGTAGVLAAAVALAVPGIGLAVAVGPALSVLFGATVGAVGGGLIGALTHVGIGDEHAHIYAEGLRRGMALLAVSGGEQDARDAADIFERHGAVDLEEYAGAWRARGWSGFSPALPPLTAAEIAAQRHHERAAGARVQVQPRPREISRTDTRDPAAAGEVLRTPGTAPARGYGNDAFGDGRFRQHFANNYGPTGARFDEYRHAYEFGYGLQLNSHIACDNWDAAEVETRAHWEREHPGTWERYRAAIRYGWDVSAPSIAQARAPLRGESRLRD